MQTECGCGAGGVVVSNHSSRPTIHFIIPGPVVAQGRPRLTTVNGYARAFDPQKSREFKQRARLWALDQRLGAPPLTGPVIVNLRFWFLPPKSWSEKKKSDALLGRIRPACKPDIDNLVKAVLDGINGVCFADDKQVVALGATKFYGDCERVDVEVMEEP